MILRNSFDKLIKKEKEVNGKIIFNIT